MPTAGRLSWLNDLLLTNGFLGVTADSGLNAGLEFDDIIAPERSQERRPLADDVGRTGGSSTGECRGTGTVEVTDTSPPVAPMRSLEQQVLFLQARRGR